MNSSQSYFIIWECYGNAMKTNNIKCVFESFSVMDVVDQESQVF